jgi:hypothetical protein
VEAITYEASFKAFLYFISNRFFIMKNTEQKKMVPESTITDINGQSINMIGIK